MATIKDIAEHAGLGLGTISKYINGGKVREKNKIAIEAAIKELGFTANEMARNLRTNRSHTIGVVIPELSNIFITTIISSVEDILRNSGYSMIVCDCRTQEQMEHEVIQFMLQKHVDGIINMPVNGDGAHLLPAIEKNIPIVLIDRHIQELEGKVNEVLVDNVKASFEATDLLVQAGHTHIGIVLGPEGVYTSKQRLLGYEQALQSKGLQPDAQYIQFSDYTIQGGYKSVRHLMEHGKPSGIFLTNYEMTLGGIIALNELNYSIPKDISFIGFDNMLLSEMIQPKLTIVSQPLAEMAAAAAAILMKNLEPASEKPACQTVVLPTEVVRGQSILSYIN